MAHFICRLILLPFYDTYYGDPKQLWRIWHMSKNPSLFPLLYLQYCVRPPYVCPLLASATVNASKDFWWALPPTLTSSNHLKPPQRHTMASYKSLSASCPMLDESCQVISWVCSWIHTKNFPFPGSLLAIETTREAYFAQAVTSVTTMASMKCGDDLEW